MKAVIFMLVLALGCVFATGCAGLLIAPVVPPSALIYTGYSAPLDLDFASTPVTGKKGSASCVNILGLIAVGDASAKKAAEDGGINKIEHADYKFMNVLGIFSEYTTIVYGE